MLHKKMKSSYDKNERKEMGNISQILKSHLEDKKIKDNPIIAKIIFPEKKVTYDIIGNSKTPKLVKINNKMSQSLLKKLTNLNEFKKMYYDFTEEEKKQLQNIAKVHDFNSRFSKKYKILQK